MREGREREGEEKRGKGCPQLGNLDPPVHWHCWWIRWKITSRFALYIVHRESKKYDTKFFIPSSKSFFQNSSTGVRSPYLMKLSQRVCGVFFWLTAYIKKLVLMHTVCMLVFVVCVITVIFIPISSIYYMLTVLCNRLHGIASTVDGCISINISYFISWYPILSYLILYRMQSTPWSIKKRATFIFMITLTNIDRFS